MFDYFWWRLIYLMTFKTARMSIHDVSISFLMRKAISTFFNMPEDNGECRMPKENELERDKSPIRHVLKHLK